jgi:predicted MFS family arabinose efflux permease
VALPAFRYAPLYWMALGTFAIGTEGFMIAALLPSVASDLRVSLQAAGELMAIFAITYALSSPILTALTGSLDRRKVLMLSMAGFTLANLVAAAAADYGSLAFARVLLAVAAGLFTPNANALAGVLVPPERRGRALAIVNGGLTVAVALGVPLGAFVGNHFGWRMTFVGVAALSAIALSGLLFGMPRGIGKDLPVAGLRLRLATLRQPAVFSTLVVTTLWAMGTYTIYTYVAPYFTTVVGLEPMEIGYMLFLWGVAAFAGVFLGGLINDKFGARRVMLIALPALALALLSLSAVAYAVPAGAVLFVVIPAVIVWGVAAWGFFPSQQARLIGIAGVSGASVVLSLNASFMYLGFSLGAGLGSVVLTHGGVADLGWVGALSVAASLTLGLLQKAGGASK